MAELNLPPFQKFQTTAAFQFAVSVVKQLRTAGFEALWAGGCVRDLLLDKEPSDYDVATTATPEEVRAVFGKKHTIPVGISFGVMMVLGDKKEDVIEVATFRKEGEYSDGRRPDSVQYCTPEEDAHRRDFTINGMFYDPLNETLFDYVGGEDDLKANRLRAIGSPKDRFTEDKLRMLRAIRFSARFSASLDEKTSVAIGKMADEILVVSWERISEEFRKIFRHPNRAYALRQCQELQLLPLLFPEVAAYFQNDDRAWLETLQILEALSVNQFELTMGILHHFFIEEGNLKKKLQSVVSRMRLSNKESERIEWLIQNQHALNNAEGLPLCKLKRVLAHDGFPELKEWTRARDTVQGNVPKDVLFCEQYLENRPNEPLLPPSLITGESLIARGMRPGPEFKRILVVIEDAQLNEEIQTEEAAWILVDQITQ